MKIFGTRRIDKFFATADHGERFIGRAGNDLLTLFSGDNTDSFVGGRGHDGVTWNINFDWTNQNYSNFGSGIKFNGGPGIDGISTTGTISSGKTALTYSFLGLETRNVETIVNVFDFANDANLDADIKLIGSKHHDFAFFSPLQAGQKADLVVKFRAGADQLSLLPEDDISSSVAYQSIDVSMGRGSDTVTLFTSADGAIFRLGRGDDVAFSDGHFSGIGSFAETFLGGGGKDTIILNSAETSQDTDTVRGGGGKDQFVVNNLRTEHTAAEILDFKSGKDEIIIIDDRLLGDSVQFDFQDTDELVYLADLGHLVYGTADDNYTVLDFNGPLDLNEDDFRIGSNFELLDFL